ncbi:MazG family protein [uncultured Amnibacterium sp.]|uniref:MazG family protein n=1 Tax=uncultured Amnibacterium sp. TaxID=1631851 RepID=UPI0035CB54C3
MPDDGLLLTEAPGHELERLAAVTARLRGPGGCPWDAEQTHASLVRYLLEEAAELTEAIESGDRAGMLEELGDVLYQVLFHADLAAATPGEAFDIDDVARVTSAKMIGRHPHVFGPQQAADADAVVVLWEEQKRTEKPERTSVLDGVPMTMPSLLLAEKLLGRAERVGLQVRPAEVSGGDAEQALMTPPASEDVLGDQLLDLVIAASAQGLDAERALRGSLRRLTDRIRTAESAPPAA